jgi:hypothetical protein
LLAAGCGSYYAPSDWAICCASVARLVDVILHLYWPEREMQCHPQAVGLEADEKAWEETKGRSGELGTPICDRLNEIEEQIANIVPTTLQDCLAQLRLLKYRWACVPDELDEKPVDDMLAGLEAIPRRRVIGGRRVGSEKARLWPGSFTYVRPMPELSRFDIDRRSDHPIELA